jgi:hypothetical protein
MVVVPALHFYRFARTHFHPCTRPRSETVKIT